MGVAYVSRGPQSAAGISMHQLNRILTAATPQTTRLREVEGDTPANWWDLSYNAYRAKKEHCAWYERRGSEMNRMPTHLSKNPRSALARDGELLLPIRNHMKMCSKYINSN